MADRPTAYIIGQSNSVMREGFARKLRQLGMLDVLGIRAVGSSASLLANWFVAGLEEPADYCIFDLAVFDMALVSGGNYRIEHMKNYLAAAIAEARLRGAEPILALIPPQWLDKHMHPAYVAQKQIAERSNCFHFDGLAWLRSLVAEERREFEAAFADPSHLNPAYSEKFARALSAAVVALHATRGAGGGERAAAVVEHPVDVVPLARCAAPETVRVAASSALTVSLVKLDPQTPLRVPVGECKRVCGLVVDAKNCSGTLKISGGGAVAKSLAFSGEPDRLGFVARVVPLVGDVSDSDGYVELAVPADALDPTEPTSGVSQAGPGAGTAHISHLLVERPARVVSYTPRPFGPGAKGVLDLAGWTVAA